MGTVLLLRHARSETNVSGVLAGRTPGIRLDETGRAQAAALVERLAEVPLAGVVCSPLQRCAHTVQALCNARGIEPVVHEGLTEVDYGDWTGRKISDLTDEAMWPVIQARPSAVRFPNGEGLAQVQARAVEAVREQDERFTAELGDDPAPVWLLCSHGDVLKSVLADACGQHLDLFQRIIVDPCSISVVRYTMLRPFLLRLNDHGSQLASVIPQAQQDGNQQDGQAGSDAGGSAPSQSDATIGGSTGTR